MILSISDPYGILDGFQLKIAMTMTEKILARAVEEPQLSLGERMYGVNVDILMTL